MTDDTTPDAALTAQLRDTADDRHLIMSPEVRQVLHSAANEIDHLQRIVERLPHDPEICLVAFGEPVPCTCPKRDSVLVPFTELESRAVAAEKRATEAEAKLMVLERWLDTHKSANFIRLQELRYAILAAPEKTWNEAVSQMRKGFADKAAREAEQKHE